MNYAGWARQGCTVLIKKHLCTAEMVRKLLLGEEGAQGSICDAMEFVLTTHTA